MKQRSYMDFKNGIGHANNMYEWTIQRMFGLRENPQTSHDFDWASDTSISKETTRYLTENELPVEYWKTQRLLNLFSSNETEQYAEEELMDIQYRKMVSSHLDKPVLVDREPDGSYSFRDGTHRVVLASQRGIDKLPVIVVDLEEYQKYR